MSVVIKGMDMPRTCDDCPFETVVGYNRSDQTKCCITRENVKGYDRPTACPLVEITSQEEMNK